MYIWLCVFFFCKFHSLEINYDFLFVQYYILNKHIFGSKCYKKPFQFNAYAHTHTNSIHHLLCCCSTLVADFSSSRINVNANLYFLNGRHDYSRHLLDEITTSPPLPPPPLNIPISTIITITINVSD